MTLVDAPNPVAFTVGDPEFVILSGTIHGSSNLYGYSCQAQYEFVCPSEYPQCDPAVFDQVFEQGQFEILSGNDRGHLKVKQTGNVAMEFHMFNMDVNGYLYSSDIIPDALNGEGGHTAQYTGVDDYAEKFSWTVPLQVTPNCSNTFIRVTEKANDTKATIGK